MTRLRSKLILVFFLLLLLPLSSLSLTTVEIDEGEVVKLDVAAQDLDNDTLSFLYFFPLNDSGEWHTTYDDAGEYQTSVIVSDGISQTTEEVKIVIKNKNRLPEKTGDITISEIGIADLRSVFVDPDGDALSFEADDYFDENGVWETTYDDAGKHEITVIVSDGADAVEEVVTVTIQDVETAPSFVTEGPFFLKENEEFRLPVEAVDAEGDEITLRIVAAPNGAAVEDGVFSWTPSFETVKRRPGFLSNLLNKWGIDRILGLKKPFAITLEACGKELCQEEKFIFVVRHVNQAPTLDDLEYMEITETEIALLVPKAHDDDGDYLRYYFSEPLSRDGTWETSYDDEGEYNITVTVSDGELIDNKQVTLLVGKNNRPPTVDTKRDQYKINERQSLAFAIDTEDPDNDELAVSLEELPPGASFKEGVLSWEPEYTIVEQDVDTVWNNIVSRSDMLNRRFNKEMEVFNLNFLADDGEFSAHRPVIVIVKNVNRAPEFVTANPDGNVEIYVDEPVVFSAAARDVDNDPISYKWSFGPWESSVKDVTSVNRTFVTSGYKEVSVTVSDGVDSVNKKWQVKVLPKPIVVMPEAAPVTTYRPATYVTYFIDG